MGDLARAEFQSGEAAQAQSSYWRMKAIHAMHPKLGPSLHEELQRIGRELASRG